MSTFNLLTFNLLSQPTSQNGDQKYMAIKDLVYPLYRSFSDADQGQNKVHKPGRAWPTPYF